MKSLKLTALALAVVGALAHAAEPAFVTQEATGEAAIVNGNKERATEEAKKKAIREAVEQVAGVLVSADTLTSNSQLVSDRIYANSSGYVRNVKVLSAKEDAGVMRVTVTAEVGKSDLDKDLQAVKALINRFGNPKVVIITQEQTIDPSGVTTGSSVLATVLTEGFKQDGWTIIDPHFAAGKLKLSSGVGIGTTEAKEIGELSKADYILYGNVNFRQQKPDGAFGSMLQDEKGNTQVFYVSGEYDLTLFATDSGSQLAKLAGKLDAGELIRSRQTVTISYERTSHDLARLRGKAIVGDVRKAALESLRNAEQNGNRLVMNVVGVADYAAVQNFKKVIAELSGVRDVKPGTFGGGKAQFDVTFVGSTDDLADKLGGRTFKGKKVSVTGVTANTMELTLAK